MLTLVELKLRLCQAGLALDVNNYTDSYLLGTKLIYLERFEYFGSKYSVAFMFDSYGIYIDNMVVYHTVVSHTSSSFIKLSIGAEQELIKYLLSTDKRYLYLADLL